MNKIVNKCLLNGDEIMLEIHLEQRGFVYSVLIGFKAVRKESNLEKIEKNRNNGDSRRVLDNTYFSAISLIKKKKKRIFIKRTYADKILRAYRIKVSMDVKVL